MARLARIVVSGRPHHVTQRGNRREAIFFEEGDQAIYLDLLTEQCVRHGVELWAYCLMPNHVHLIVVPAKILGRKIARKAPGRKPLNRTITTNQMSLL